MAVKKVTSIFAKENFNMLLVLALIVCAFAIGYLFNKVQSLEKGGSSNTNIAAGNANNQPSNPSVPTPPQAGDVDPVSDSDHVRGNRNATIALIEYSDYECPYCKSFHPTAQQALDEFGENLMWVYRHFPLDQLHPKARPSAIASECVAKLGGNDAFWKFTDTLFNATSWTIADLPNFATQAGVDKAAFESCQKDSSIADIVQNQYESGISAGVSGTPGNILLNTKTGEKRLIPGAVPFASLQSAIGQMLSEG